MFRQGSPEFIEGLSTNGFLWGAPNGGGSPFTLGSPRSGRVEGLSAPATCWI